MAEFARCPMASACNDISGREGWPDHKEDRMERIASYRAAVAFSLCCACGDGTEPANRAVDDLPATADDRDQDPAVGVDVDGEGDGDALPPPTAEPEPEPEPAEDPDFVSTLPPLLPGEPIIA